MWRVAYLDTKKRYGVFTHDGNGVVDPAYNAADVREKVITLAHGRAAVDGLASPRAPRACPYLTIGTFNSNPVGGVTQEVLQALNERIKREKLERDIVYLQDIGLWA